MILYYRVGWESGMGGKPPKPHTHIIEWDGRVGWDEPIPHTHKLLYGMC